MKVTWENLVLYSIGKFFDIGNIRTQVYGLKMNGENITLICRDENFKTYYIDDIGIDGVLSENQSHEYRSSPIG